MSSQLIGICCPDCGGDSKVVDSRHRPGGFIYRRRECLDCGEKFSTDERITGQRAISEADDFADQLEDFATIVRRHPRLLLLIEAYSRGELLVIDEERDPVFFKDVGGRTTSRA